MKISDIAMGTLTISRVMQLTDFMNKMKEPESESFNFYSLRGSNMIWNKITSWEKKIRDEHLNTKH